MNTTVLDVSSVTAEQREVLTREVAAFLNRTPGAVRVREGGGDEDLAKSFAVTVAKLRPRHWDRSRVALLLADMVETYDKRDAHSGQPVPRYRGVQVDCEKQLCRIADELNAFFLWPPDARDEPITPQPVSVCFELPNASPEIQAMHVCTKVLACLLPTDFDARARVAGWLETKCAADSFNADRAKVTP